MATLKKRTIITLRPEWEPKLDKLKKNSFTMIQKLKCLDI